MCHNIIQSLEGRDVPGQFGLIQWSGNVFGAILNEITYSHACMWCIGSRFQALGPATANALHGCLKHLCYEDRLKLSNKLAISIGMRPYFLRNESLLQTLLFVVRGFH